MQLLWSAPARRDLQRLYSFLREVNPRAAKNVLKQLDAAANRLRSFPQIAPRLEVYADRDVRALMVGDYELRYEVKRDALIVVRVWHTREER
ncbi:MULTISPECIES: type II toxin-antitoxin system RelE/ParE family toxin [Asticcacaulis]|uniref:type II toxin-antitoxin system RelE/ParE family toxin n=1 Tax=Asticcacaulis TaxID=76890 RepID=UPI001AE91058|nr:MULTISPECIES: type II toxin-antitoxin system RelE/ParE family toxin [Asticcacaulis]